jgi:poly-gamma-glutamate synthesis protein (capsule biosynthesis protein)
MKHHKPGWSIGTILTLLLTVLVTAGCLFMFGKMRGQGTSAKMDAQRVIGLMNSAFQGPTPAPAAQNQVRTVKVTLAPVTAAPEADTPAPMATPAPTEPPASLPPYTFSLTAGGLLSFQSDISDTVYSKENKTADYRPVLSRIGSKVYADLNLVTLPQIINVSDRKYGDAITLSEAADAVQSLGMEQVALASEHILDQGVQGAADTVSALSGSGLSCTGVNVSGASQRRLVPLNGGTVAILSYSEALTAKGRNAQKENAGVLQLFSLDTARADIRWARSQGARCVIVCMYWGKSDAVEVTRAQKSTAQSLAQMGADIILGTRPSRVLPMEIITCTGEDGKARDAFVAYSLGTLLSESREPYDISGILLHLNVFSDEQGRMHFQGVEYTPTYIWRQEVNNKIQYSVVCSADPAPEEMSSQQKEVMKRALNRVQSILENTPVTQRP